METLRLFVQSLAIPMGFRVQRLRSDRGTEYEAGYSQKYCLDTGIRQEFTFTSNPQQNGVSGRDGRTLTEMARCLLSEGGFLKSLWGKCSSQRLSLPKGRRTRHSKTRPPMSACMEGTQTFGCCEPSALELSCMWRPIPKNWPRRSGRINFAVTARIVEHTVYTT